MKMTLLRSKLPRMHAQAEVQIDSLANAVLSQTLQLVVLNLATGQDLTLPIPCEYCALELVR